MSPQPLEGEEGPEPLPVKKKRSRSAAVDDGKHSAPDSDLVGT